MSEADCCCCICIAFLHACDFCSETKEPIGYLNLEEDNNIQKAAKSANEKMH